MVVYTYTLELPCNDSLGARNSFEDVIVVVRTTQPFSRKRFPVLSPDRWDVLCMASTCVTPDIDFAVCYADIYNLPSVFHQFHQSWVECKSFNLSQPAVSDFEAHSTGPLGIFAFSFQVFGMMDVADRTVA